MTKVHFPSRKLEASIKYRTAGSGAFSNFVPDTENIYGLSLLA